MAVTKHHDRKSKLERKGLIWLTLPSIVQHSRKSGQGLKQGSILEEGPDAEATEGNCLLGCSFWDAQHALLWNAGPPAQERGHSPWTGPSPLDHLMRNT